MRVIKSIKELGLNETEVKELSAIIHKSNPLVFISCEEAAKDILLAGYKRGKNENNNRQ